VRSNSHDISVSIFGANSNSLFRPEGQVHVAPILQHADEMQRRVTA
jgi:hypothetical protein